MKYILFLILSLFCFGTVPMAVAGGIQAVTNANENVWGAPNVGLIVNGSSASIQFDCGSASITSGWGGSNNKHRTRFTVNGTYTQGRGILPQGHNPPPPQVFPAKFKVFYKKNSMSLKMTTNGQTKVYTLTRGVTGPLYRCG